MKWPWQDQAPALDVVPLGKQWGVWFVPPVLPLSLLPWLVLALVPFQPCRLQLLKCQVWLLQHSWVSSSCLLPASRAFPLGCCWVSLMPKPCLLTVKSHAVPSTACARAAGAQMMWFGTCGSSECWDLSRAVSEGAPGGLSC